MMSTYLKNNTSTLLSSVKEVVSDTCFLLMYKISSKIHSNSQILSQYILPYLLYKDINNSITGVDYCYYQDILFPKVDFLTIMIITSSFKAYCLNSFFQMEFYQIYVLPESSESNLSQKYQIFHFHMHSDINNSTVSVIGDCSSPGTDVAVVHVGCNDVCHPPFATLTVNDHNMHGVWVEPRVDRLAYTAEALKGRGNMVRPATVPHPGMEAGQVLTLLRDVQDLWGRINMVNRATHIQGATHANQLVHPQTKSLSQQAVIGNIVNAFM